MECGQYRIYGYRVGWDGGTTSEIIIDHECTVDLSQATNPEGSLYCLFRIKGNNVKVTFKTGNREEPLNLGSSLLFTVDGSSYNPTVILDAVNITCNVRLLCLFVSLWLMIQSRPC